MNNENFELENMREQMNTLKNKLEKQAIVSDRYIRQSMKQTASNISRRYYAIMALCIFMIPYGYWVFVKMCGFSLTFWIVTSIFMLICGGATYYNNRNVNNANLMRSNLIEASRKMARAKKFEANWLFFGIPTAILWFSWFMYNLYTINAEPFHEGLFWGGCIGGFIGTVLGIRINLKTQRQYQEIIETIEDITADQQMDTKENDPYQHDR